MFLLVEACEDSTVLKIIHFILQLLKTGVVLVPVALIILGMIDFFKAATSNDESKMKQAVPTFTRRIIGSIIIFLVPALISFAFGLLGSDIKEGYLACIANATPEKILQIKKQEEEELAKKNEEYQKQLAEAKKKNEEEEKNNQKNTTTTKGKKTGPEALIACANYYSKKLDEAVKKGEKWVYSNSSKYVRQSGTFEQMLNYKTGIRGGNCASLANWAFRDMGIMGNKDKFYGDSNGKIAHYHNRGKNVKKEIDAVAQVINFKGKKFGNLVKQGKIVAGDIILGKGHTFIYRGGAYVFASGHDAKWHSDSSVKTEDSRKAVFEKWIRKYKGTYDDTFAVQYVIHLKDSYVPEYYRDENGKLIKNK